ncbi:hypothetical protein MSG28_001548 [Choristoneura fumiferana]|uniref:Uncharacterized protein n=1 Tax=Choristoneura fumiferana TaxID=7141 RepID=A0ACC0KUJ8_CHOFU|nr:hypothetical protein MSG28_001548 [Choristoneura fumiferana]
MPCGKRPLVKTWDKPRHIRVITPSVLEQTEASVKIHWKKVIRDLELFYKDDQGDINKAYSMSDFEPSVEEEEVDVEDEEWSESSDTEEKLPARSKSIVRSMVRSKSLVSTKSMTKSMSKSFLKFNSKQFSKSFSSKSRHKSVAAISSIDETAATNDDLIVQPSIGGIRRYLRRAKNPHFDMLYCNESETDMIKWKSKYKQKTMEVSASDEFSKKAEIMTKKISKEFYEWWVDLGNLEFKSEIKRPEDIEDLFQVWFDEHASRGLILDPKILPCVLQSIANYVGVPRTSCPRVLKRQIAYDIHAETSPEHTTAFGTGLPQKMKHIPPKNNTEKMWHCVVIPEDLKSMSAVWDDVSHLTKRFSYVLGFLYSIFLIMFGVLTYTFNATDMIGMWSPIFTLYVAGSGTIILFVLTVDIKLFTRRIRKQVEKLRHKEEEMELEHLRQTIARVAFLHIMAGNICLWVSAVITETQLAYRAYEWVQIEKNKIGIFFIIWRYIGKCCHSREEVRDFHHSLYAQTPHVLDIHISCRNSMGGLFSSLFVIVILIVSIIMGFVFGTMDNEYLQRIGHITTHSIELFFHGTMLFVTAVAFWKTRTLDINKHPVPWLDDALLYICVPAFFLETMFTTVATISALHIIQFLDTITMSLQMIIQMAFIVDGCGGVVTLEDCGAQSRAAN